MISVQVQAVHSLTSQFARYHSSVLSEGHSSDNYRGWKRARQLLEQIRLLSIIFHYSRRFLDHVLNAPFVNNWDEIRGAEIERCSLSRDIEYPKLLCRHSNRRSNIPVPRRELVEDYRDRNLY